MQKVNVYVHIWNELRSNDRFGINATLLIASTKVQQTHTSLWDCVGLSENKSLSVTINNLIASSPHRLIASSPHRLIAYIDAVLFA